MSPPSEQNRLSGSARLAAVVMVISLGVWGCARGPADQSSNSDRVRAVEARCVKLEQDYRSVAHARDKARKDLTAAAEESTRLQKELADHEALLKERDELRKQLKSSQNEREQIQQLVAQRTSERDELQQQMVQRTNERDTLLGRCDRLRKGLQDLLIQDDMPPSVSPTPQTSPGVVGPVLSNQS